MMSQKDLFTEQLDNLSLSFICGIDEAGRGPLAGPVTAAAVVLNEDFPIALLQDSKKLGEKKRLEIEVLIKEQALSWAVAVIDHSIIDEINILQATLLAMEEAFFSMLEKNPSPFLDTIIVDGNKIPQKLSAFQNGKIDCLAIPKADANYPSVM
nr:ribonuclease HII [Treponemataceae bacterium]